MIFSIKETPPTFTKRLSVPRREDLPPATIKSEKFLYFMLKTPFEPILAQKKSLERV